MSRLNVPSANRKSSLEKSPHFHSQPPQSHVSDHPRQAVLRAPGLPVGVSLCAGCLRDGEGAGCDPCVWHQQG